MRYREDPEGIGTRVLAQVADFDGKEVLDIGCGSGRIALAVAPRARWVVGLDPKETELERARRRTPEALRGRVEWRLADATRAELPEATFDLVVFSLSL